MCQSYGAMKALMELKGCAVGDWVKWVGLVKTDAEWEPTELTAWTRAGAGVSTGAQTDES